MKSRRIQKAAPIGVKNAHARKASSKLGFISLNRSFLNDKMKRSHKRIIEERRERFIGG